MDRLTPHGALKKLAEAADRPYLKLFEHGSLEVEIYRPDRIDRQQPHSRDEVYVVISGSGFFVNGDERHPFEPGEVLFVAAGVEHRFEDFTEDFATWVLFYGPEGGENSKSKKRITTKDTKDRFCSSRPVRRRLVPTGRW